MKLWYRLFPKDLKITTFSRGWWFYVIMTIISLILFTLYGNNLSLENRPTLILITSIIEYIILRAYKLYMIRTDAEYHYFNDLPCYLCNQSTILCIIASLTGNSHLMAFCIIPGCIGSMLAFTFPDQALVDKPFYSIQTLGFYGYHSLLVVTCLSFYTLGLYKPDLTDALWNMAIMLLLGTFTHFVNVLLIKTDLNPISNYSFTIHPTNGFTQMLYNLYPKQFFYMLPCIPIIGALSFTILLLLKVI